jgi:hypothetical protein
VLPDRYPAIAEKWIPVELESWGLPRLFELSGFQSAEAWSGALRPVG